jgi:protein TonB
MKWSCGLHGLVLLVALVGSLIAAFRPKEISVSDFTVVMNENLVEPNEPAAKPDTKPPEPAQPETKTPEPETAKPDEPAPEAAPPAPLPEPPKDALVIEKQKPKPKVEKPKPTEKPKPVEKKKEPEKKPFVKGRRVEVPVPTPAPTKPKEDFTKLKPVSHMPVSRSPVTDRMLSRAEIERALQAGARPGTQNQIPPDEVSRCVSLVRRAMYEAWDQPGAGDAGSRPALLDIQLDSTGRVVSYHIRQSSGSAYFDQTVLKAAAKAEPIRGLSLAFLKEYETLTVEFKLEQ